MCMTSRRHFMQQLLAAMAAMAVPIRIHGAGRRRRHLINLIGSGGWDSSWFHNAFSQRALGGVEGAFASQSKGGFEYEKDGSAFKYTQKASSADEAELMAHPNYGAAVGSGRVMGAAMKLVFSPQDLNDFLVWRGLIPAGGHGFGNNLILHGNSSSYAVGYSGLVAQAMELADYRRPLHYVMMAERPSGLFTNQAMASGAAVPICIPNADQFAELTRMDPRELPDRNLQDVLRRTVESLTSEVLGGGVRQKGSKVATQAFRANFDGANFIYGSDVTRKPEFKYSHKRFVLAMLRAYAAAKADANLMSRGELFPTTIHWWQNYAQVISEIGGALAKLQPLPPYDAFIKNPAAYAEGLDDIQKLPDKVAGLAAPGYAQGLVNHAYYFAFAEYMVKSDFSAVVDVPAWTGFMDAHGAHFNELFSMLQTFAGFRELIASLKEVKLPDQGGTLFDATLIALHTEFDRWHFHNAKAFNQGPNDNAHVGTNHADTASLILAGHGIQNGRVVGDTHQGPGVHGAFGKGYLSPLPIDVQTGLPKPASQGGRKISTLAVAPTVLAAFNVTVPIQQITEWSAVPAVIKKT